jgi:hypothetical protein
MLGITMDRERGRGKKCFNGKELEIKALLKLVDLKPCVIPSLPAKNMKAL